MVDFDKLLRKKPAIDVGDPLKLFESLDRKSSHSTLREPQINALKQLRDRRSSRDLVLKMPTGMGKTAVALLYLKSHMSEHKQVGVYLCPTIQLVAQVLAEAASLGISASHYAKG